ncbi:MAG: hypothetical protein J7K66_06120 [Anaerolineaceae bacterium]|nr:hypothetical protein [Anaerolineaceae bacterium]
MKHSRKLNAILLALFLLLGFLATREFLLVNILAYVNQQAIWGSRRFIAFVVFCALSLAMLVLAIRAAWKGVPFLPGLKKAQRLPARFKQFGAVFLTALPALVKWFVPLPDTIDLGFWTSFFLMYCAALAAVWFTEDEGAQPQSQMLKISTYWLVGGAIYAVCAKLVFVTGYPFPLYWSEGNRFFDYSTLFGSYRYLVPEGKDIYSFISWGMQLPWALPFILPALSIRAFRLWYQLVWILPAFLLGISAYKTFGKKKELGTGALIFGLWAFVFLNQGPIYAPLLIAGILVMVGLRFRLVPAVLAVTLASFYAYESRWTWSFAPGLWAGLATLLMIESPSFHKGAFKELLRPIALGLGGLFGGRILPDLIPLLASWFSAITAKSNPSSTVPRGAPSPNIKVLPNIISSATHQPLLWERLLPNSTYPPGILLGVVWAVLPVIILLVVLAVKKIWRPNWLQAAAVSIVSAGLFAVGLTASVKIGGGSNLHNLDMFLVTIAITTAAALVNSWPRGKDASSTKFWVSAMVAMVMILPVTYTLRPSAKLHLPDTAEVEESLSAIRKEIAKTPSNEDILFIDHRQLLTFNFVPQVPLIDEYEKKKLMDEAMSADVAYFESFYEDIRGHRFALIINEPLNVIIRGEDFSFGNENDAYVKWVTLPLTCCYEAIYTNKETGVELLVPRRGPPPALLPCEQFVQ